MPSWAFRRQLDGDPGTKQLVVMADGTASLSNEQGCDYLLCGDCEQKIGTWDNYVSRMAWQLAGTLTAVAAASAAPAMPGMYRLGLDVDAITRFAISVFWRTSISSRFPDFRLDQRCEEELREFLAGHGALPDDLRLTLSLIVPNDSPVDQIMAWPSSRRLDGFCREYVFIVPGLHFVMHQGAKFSVGIDTMCFARTGLVTISDGITLHDWLIKRGEATVLKGKLAARM